MRRKMFYRKAAVIFSAVLAIGNLLSVAAAPTLTLAAERVETASYEIEKDKAPQIGVDLSESSDRSVLGDYDDDKAELTIYPSGTGDHILYNAFFDRFTYGISPQKIVIKSGVKAPKDCSCLFYACESLHTADLSGLDTSNVENMTEMFMFCVNLQSVDLSSFDTSNVTDMSRMFSLCHYLSDLNVSGFNTSKVTDMGGMFGQCWTLDKIDVSNFDTSNVEFTNGMFDSCKSLETIDVSSFNMSKVITAACMFSGCDKLKSIDLSGFKFKNARDISSLLSGCSSLTDIKLDGIDTSTISEFGSMFANCTALEEIDVDKIDTTSANEMISMFSGCSSLKELDLSSFNTSNVTSTASMFENCEKLENLDLSSFDTSKTRFWAGMFKNCKSMKKLDLSNFEITVSNNDPLLTDAGKLFTGCDSLEELITPKTCVSGYVLNKTMHDIDGTKYTELPATSKKLIADKDEVNPDEPTDPTDPTDPSDPSEPGSSPSGNEIEPSNPTEPGSSPSGNKVSPSENEIFVPGVAANAKNYITINSAYAGAKIKYKSSDKKIAAVNGKGVIKFKKNGIVTITAIDKKSKTELGSHTFNVIMPEITQKNVEVTQGTVSINGFDYLKNANSKVAWVSSKPSVASVDASSGEIKITGTGKAKIYAVFGASDIKDKNGSKKKYKFTLKVK